MPRISMRNVANPAGSPTGPKNANNVQNSAGLAALALKAHGVSKVFAVCGDHVNSLFHALAEQGIEIVGARHEGAAVQMADGWARVTGSPGVAVVTGGPGHTNAITGAAVAQGALSPVVIISGQAIKARRERGGNQSLYQSELMRPVTKWSIEVEDAGSTSELIDRAMRIAKSGTPGPVSISIPVDLASTAVATNLLTIRASPQTSRTASDCGSLAKEQRSSIRYAAKLLMSAERPVVVVGGNLWSHIAPKKIERILRRLGIPVFTNGPSRGLIRDDGIICFGHANPFFNATFRTAASADLFLLIGATPDYNFGSGNNCVAGRGARIVQIHRDPLQIGVGRMPDAAIVGEHVPILNELEAGLRGHRIGSRLLAWKQEFQKEYRAQQSYWNHLIYQHRQRVAGVHPALLCRALRDYWTPHTTMVFDVGDFTNWPKAYFPVQEPAQFLDGGALGNLGGALPLAIGAQMANPSSPVWVFIGDGGFGYHSWELAIAAEKKLPLKVIVGNDSCWGTEKRLQQMEFGNDVACDLPTIRYDKFAELVSVPSFRARNTTHLNRVTRNFVALPGPSLLQVELTRLAGRPFQTVRTSY